MHAANLEVSRRSGCGDVEEMPAGAVLPSNFFRRGSSEVASDLVGKIVWRVGYGGGRLTEVEAYLPVGDAASHAALGPTKRNASMFGEAGRMYVFVSYGVHRLLNFVCDEAGVGSAVLVRSFEPLSMMADDVGNVGARGPGIVGRKLGVCLDMNGQRLGEESGVYVLDDGDRPRVGRTERIGISRSVDLPLRHYMVGSRYVSGPANMRERVLR